MNLVALWQTVIFHFDIPRVFHSKPGGWGGFRELAAPVFDVSWEKALGMDL